MSITSTATCSTPFSPWDSSMDSFFSESHVGYEDILRKYPELRNNSINLPISSTCNKKTNDNSVATSKQNASVGSRNTVIKKGGVEQGEGANKSKLKQQSVNSHSFLIKNTCPSKKNTPLSTVKEKERSNKNKKSNGATSSRDVNKSTSKICSEKTTSQSGASNDIKRQLKTNNVKLVTDPDPPRRSEKRREDEGHVGTSRTKIQKTTDKEKATDTTNAAQPGDEIPPDRATSTGSCLKGDFTVCEAIPGKSFKAKRERKREIENRLVAFRNLLSEHVRYLPDTIKATIKTFNEMDNKYQCICLGLITNCKKWHPIFKFSRDILPDMEPTDISKMFTVLKTNGFIDTGEQIFWAIKLATILSYL